MGLQELRQSQQNDIDADELEDGMDMLPQLGGLSRLQTDPAADADVGATADTGVLENGGMLPELSGLTRLQTDPAAQEAMAMDMHSESVPSKVISRLQTDQDADLEELSALPNMAG